MKRWLPLFVVLSIVGVAWLPQRVMADSALKARADAVVIPTIDFKDASLNAVLDFLPKLAAQQKFTLNIVRLFPKAYGDEKHITLQLSEVPVSSVLEYVADAGGLQVQYDAAAVILKMPEKTGPATGQ